MMRLDAGRSRLPYQPSALQATQSIRGRRQHVPLEFVCVFWAEMLRRALWLLVPTRRTARIYLPGLQRLPPFAQHLGCSSPPSKAPATSSGVAPEPGAPWRRLEQQLCCAGIRGQSPNQTRWNSLEEEPVARVRSRVQTSSTAGF